MKAIVEGPRDVCNSVRFQGELISRELAGNEEIMKSPRGGFCPIRLQKGGRQRDTMVGLIVAWGDWDQLGSQ